MDTPVNSSRGSALLEVLVTITILAFGLLGVAGLQARIHVMEYESYQRAQAVVILADIAERIGGNKSVTATYAAASPLGTGHATRASCAAIADASEKVACADIDQWDQTLLGSGEKVGGAGVGAMQDARACITAFTSTTNIFNRCQTGVQIDIVWRGRSATIVPASTCGAGSYGGNDAYRRVISTRVGTGDVAC